MKRSFLILSFCISLVSCKKTDETANPLKNGFIQILKDYAVTSIAFDNEGNAWIGTFEQGVIKYNPQETIVYHSGNSSLPDSSLIWDIAVDSKNNVWIGCEGLIKYDGTEFTYYNASNSPIPEDNVPSIAIDSKDNIWFSSCRARQGGIVKYNGSSWMVYTPGNSPLPAHFVRSIAIDSDDNVWLALNEIAADARLVKISGDKWTSYTSADLGVDPYSFGNIRINSQNKLYASIDYSFSSVLTDSRLQAFTFDGISSEILQCDAVSTFKFISLDHQDNVWCAFYGGYAVYNGEKWAVNNSTFKETSILAIESSPDKTIWIGTGEGIYIKE